MPVLTDAVVVCWHAVTAEEGGCRSGRAGGAGDAAGSPRRVRRAGRTHQRHDDERQQHAQSAHRPAAGHQRIAQLQQRGALAGRTHTRSGPCEAAKTRIDSGNLAAIVENLFVQSLCDI